MKKVLLSFTLIASVVLAKAQTPNPLPFFDNFDNNSNQLPPADWYTSLTLGQIGVSPYNNPVVAGCPSNPGGFVVSPPSNSDPIIFITPDLADLNPGRQILFRFSLHAFSSNALTCASNITTPCTATVKIYLVSSSNTDPSVPQSSTVVYGSSASTVVSTSSNANPTASVSAVIPASVVPGTTFRVLLHVESLGACGNSNSTRYVIDNVNILDVAQIVTPVSFKTFNAARNKSNVAINWTTASEQNNNGFYIQRNDGSGWKNVAFVFSQAQAGNSSSDLSYNYSDPNNIKGISQYRILQVDIDGKSKFSEIRSVKGDGQLAKLIVYPNPSSTGDVNVVFDGQTARDVNVTDFSGRLIKKYSSVINNLEIKGLTTGVYSILVTEKLTGVKTVQKVIVK